MLLCPSTEIEQGQSDAMELHSCTSPIRATPQTSELPQTALVDHLRSSAEHHVVFFPLLLSFLSLRSDFDNRFADRPISKHHCTRRHQQHSLPHQETPTKSNPVTMGLFIPFVFALAVFWLVIGVMLAKFLAQKYKGKPWSSKAVDSQYIYGNALQNDQSTRMHSGGYGVGGQAGGFNRGYGRETVSMGQFGQGRMKGM